MTNAAPTLLEQLQLITEQLAAATTPAAVYQIVLEPALRALGAVSGLVMLLNLESGVPCLNTVAQHGHVAGVPSIWQPTDLSDTAPSTDALRGRVPLYFSHSGDLRAAYPDLEAQTGAISPVATAVMPMLLDAAPLGVLLLDFREPHDFTPEEQRFLRTLAAQCALALGRAHLLVSLERQVQARTEALAQQNAELTVQQSALESFALLARDLAFETDPYLLIRRAQDIVLPLLPRGAAAYYELEDHIWRLKAQSQQIVSEALWRVLQAGLPFERTPLLSQPWETGQPQYHDQYDARADHLEEASHVGACAALPLRVGDQVAGVFVVGLFEPHTWTNLDRISLETVMHSLSLALERARSAAALVQRTQALEAANEELEGFTYSVSHDLRTPVRHVSGFAALARRALSDVPDPAALEKAGRYLGIVEQAALQMNALVDAILDLSRTSRSELHLTEVDLNVLLTRAQAQFAAASAQVQWAISTLPVVPGDAATLQQVMAQLVSNALKFSRHRQPAQITVWAETRPGEWAIFVRDNGVGFDHHYQHKLFGMFQRLHRVDEFEGAGVGLASVRRIISRHGGQVLASVNEGGQGATFGFTLPRLP